ncbi:MAG: hypothetical protein HYU51_16110 [Candidatus Rokubacteria bacterium]|nr:hypothetical protein [Candidatus Rokubacteria bacterium]
MSIDRNVHETVARYAAHAKIPKSRVIEEAVRVWERTRHAALAREGYRKMADEDLADAEAYLAVLDELAEIE